MDHRLVLDIVILMVGFVIGYFFYMKYKTAVGGVIATPFLVIYVIREPAIILSTGLAISMGLIALEIVHDRFLIYGRRAFYIAAFISMIVFLTTYNYIDIEARAASAFTSLIGGIIAYNMHKEIVTNGDYVKPIVVWISEFASTLVVGTILYFLLIGWPP